MDPGNDMTQWEVGRPRERRIRHLRRAFAQLLRLGRLGSLQKHLSTTLLPITLNWVWETWSYIPARACPSSARPAASLPRSTPPTIRVPTPCLFRYPSLLRTVTHTGYFFQRARDNSIGVWTWCSVSIQSPRQVHLLCYCELEDWDSRRSPV